MPICFRVLFLGAFSLTAFLTTPLATFGQTPGFSSKQTVGRLDTNVFYTPVNQILTPAGLQVQLPELRPQALALSPDGRLLVTSGKTHEIIVIAPASGQILQRVRLPGKTTAEAS